jgi:predicted ester cyclase
MGRFPSQRLLTHKTSYERRSGATGVFLAVGDDALAAELEFNGTISGPLNMGGIELPATGRQITGHGTYFVRAEDDKITEFHAHPNAAEMMMQLGLMPG